MHFDKALLRSRPRIGLATRKFLQGYRKDPHGQVGWTNFWQERLPPLGSHHKSRAPSASSLRMDRRMVQGFPVPCDRRVQAAHLHHTARHSGRLHQIGEADGSDNLRPQPVTSLRSFGKSGVRVADRRERSWHRTAISIAQMAAATSVFEKSLPTKSKGAPLDIAVT